VPPPSNFNRRVTPELDAISLKALARDVADRYQTAAQLAADLDALIAGYRFDPKELRQFIRQLFRKEYAKEIEDTQLSLDTEAGQVSMSAGRVPTMPGVPTGLATERMDAVAPPPEITIQHEAAPPPPQGAVPARGSGWEQPPPEPEGEKPKSGFWGSLFKKKK
jgi:hypothetical protein